MCVCVFVCVYAHVGERVRERVSEKEREREQGNMCVRELRSMICNIVPGSVIPWFL